MSRRYAMRTGRYARPDWEVCWHPREPGSPLICNRPAARTFELGKDIIHVCAAHAPLYRRAQS